MTNSSPPEPPTPRSRGLRRDEQVAIMVAFAAIGAIMWWALKLAPESSSMFDLDSWLNLDGANTPSEKRPTDATSSTEPVTQPGEATDTDPTGTQPQDGSVGGIVPVPIPLPNGDASNKTDTNAATTPSEEDIAASPTPVPTPEIPVNPNLPPPSPTERIAFADIPAGYWALPFIDGLSERKVVAGLETKESDGDPVVNYEPERPVTRAEFAAQLQKVFALSDRQEAKQFTDIPGDYWAAPAITESNQGGYMNGYPEGNFRPDRQIPRLELLVALATGLQLPLPENPDAILEVYQDASQIPNWAKPKIAAATQAGLVAGHPNPKLFNPSTAATRAEVAATLYQALVVGKEAQPIESEYLVKPNQQP
jgi:S-layer homology domain